MKSETIILGGGIVGQMAKQVLPEAIVFERNEASNRKPNQAFGTNYLWEPIPLFQTQEMEIHTHVDGRDATTETIKRYKNKIGKSHEGESEWGLQFAPMSRGHFIVEYPMVSIFYEHNIWAIDLTKKSMVVETPSGGKTFEYDNLISTIPLNELVRLTGMDKAFPVKTIFKFRPVFIKIQPKPMESPYTDKQIYVNYISNPLVEPYRYCDRFGERHYESLLPMGFPHKKISPGKIWKNPLINSVLKALEQANVTCLGRYGRWNPNELLHETYADLMEKVEAVE